MVPFPPGGVNLLGIGSVLQPFTNRQAAWARVTTDTLMNWFEAKITMATLDDLPRLGRAFLAGQIKGRIVTDLNT